MCRYRLLVLLKIIFCTFSQKQSCNSVHINKNNMMMCADNPSEPLLYVHIIKMQIFKAR